MWLYLPLRLLLPKYKSLSIVKFPLSLDKLPSKELLYKDKYINSLHLNRLIGILPEIWFEVKLNTCNLGRWSNIPEGTKPWWGFPPLKLLLPKFKYFSQFKLANSMGKGPWKVLWRMSYYFICQMCN